MRFEISFEAAGDLILVEAVIVGPRGPRELRLVLDTGCALTTLLPEVAEELGYSVDDRIRLSVVQSAVGVEHGYVIQVPAVTALGVTLRDVHVNVCDLGFDDLDGLLGMTFLNELNYEIRWAERRILVENRTFWLPALDLGVARSRFRYREPRRRVRQRPAAREQSSSRPWS